MFSSRLFCSHLMFTGIFLLTLLLVVDSSNPSDSLYNCVDWECGSGGEWISKGKTLLRYIGRTDRHLSFQKNEDIFVIAKPKDKSLPDWVGKVGDKIGFVPLSMIREDKMNTSPKKQLKEEQSLAVEQPDVSIDQPITLDSTTTINQREQETVSEITPVEEKTFSEPTLSVVSKPPVLPPVTAEDTNVIPNPKDNNNLSDFDSETTDENTKIDPPSMVRDDRTETMELLDEKVKGEQQPDGPFASDSIDPSTEVGKVDVAEQKEHKTAQEIISIEEETSSKPTSPISEPPLQPPVIPKDINNVIFNPVDQRFPDDSILEKIELDPLSLSSNDESKDLTSEKVPAEQPNVSVDSSNKLDTVIREEDAVSEIITDIPFDDIGPSSTPDIVERREQEGLQEAVASSTEESWTESTQLSKELPSPVIFTVDDQESHRNQPVDQEDDIYSDDHDHDHDHHHHHHHHHHHQKHNFLKDSNDTSSVILVIKHLSLTLLSFLPEPLQDTILDVDDALVFTGIIALTLVSICVPYFLIEGYMSVRPLKRKVVELNKSLWKVSAAYETQQEEFELFKQKAIAHDELKKKAEQSENDVVILKKLETKHREQITALKTQMKSHMREAIDIKALIEKTLQDKKMVSEECGKYKAAYENARDALIKVKEESTSYQARAKSSVLQLGVTSKNAEMLTSKIAMINEEMNEIKGQLTIESEKRKLVEKEKQQLEHSKVGVEKELAEIKSICHQYEETVSGLNEEISKLESELTSIKESLGEDSPLLEVAEIQAKAVFSEKEAESLRTRLEGFSVDNENLRGKLKETTAALEEALNEREQTNNRLQVLETYFKEREEEYLKTIEQLQLKESVRDKGKEELIRIIEEKENVCKDLNDRLDALIEEFEETKQQHRNEIRSLEAKGHENWLSLCQAERKAQDARKEAELLRQRLTALSKEKDDEDVDGLNGEVPGMFPVIPHELVPLPLLDEPPSYFGLGDFIPPPPLPEGEGREPHRPPPLGGRLSPSFSDFDDNILSPIGGVGRREEDCTDGSSGSDSPRQSPPLRGGWVNVQHNRGGQGRDSMRRLSRATSSPIQPGANL